MIMFQALTLDINTFITDRNWNYFHHPQSLATALAIEVAEVLELFIDLKNTTLLLEEGPLREDLKEEMGDVMNLTLTLIESLKLDLEEVINLPNSKTIREVQKHIHTIEEESSPINALLKLSFRANRLLESFLWLSEEDSRNFNLLPRDTERLKSTFFALANLAYLLDIDLIEAGKLKLQKNLIKFPVEQVRGTLVKHKDRVYKNPLDSM